MAHNLRVYGMRVVGPAPATSTAKKLRVYGIRVVGDRTPRVLRVYGMRIAKDPTPKVLRVYGIQVVSLTQPATPVQRKVGGNPAAITLFRKVGSSQVEIT